MNLNVDSAVEPSAFVTLTVTLVESEESTLIFPKPVRVSLPFESISKFVVLSTVYVTDVIAFASAGVGI